MVTMIVIVYLQHFTSRLSVCVEIIIYHNFFIPTVAVVGLNQTLYSIMEEDLQVVVCVVVGNLDKPDETCPVAFAFDVVFSTLDDTAGK